MKRKQGWEKSSFAFGKGRNGLAQKNKRKAEGREYRQEQGKKNRLANCIGAVTIQKGED